MYFLDSFVENIFYKKVEKIYNFNLFIFKDYLDLNF